MRHILLITATMIVAVMELFAQNNAKDFKLKGHLKGAVMDSVYLQYHSGNKTINEQQRIKNGIFSFSGQLTEPGSATLRFTQKNKVGSGINLKKLVYSLFFDGGVIGFSGDLAEPSSIRISGSQPQADWELYNTITKREKNFDKQVKLTYDFMISHPNSYISAYLLNMYSAMLPLDSTKAVYDALNIVLQQGTVGETLQKIILTREASAPGKMALDFSATDVYGKSLTLSAFKGKYVLLDFWASWCVPCRKSHPHLISLYNKYKDKGFDIIGIASDMGREAVWKEAIEKDHVGIWHHVLEGEEHTTSADATNTITNRYGVAALPTKILIDPEGKIIGRFTGNGGDDIDIQLFKIFN